MSNNGCVRVAILLRSTATAAVRCRLWLFDWLADLACCSVAWLLSVCRCSGASHSRTHSADGARPGRKSDDGNGGVVRHQSQR